MPALVVAIAGNPTCSRIWAEPASQAATSLLEPFPRRISLIWHQTEEHVLLPCHDHGEEFEFGLTLILNGPNEPERPESQ